MAITPLPPAPLPSDTPAQFNEKAFDLVAALEDFVTEANAQAVAVNADAVSADADAATATTQAGIATTQAGIATTKAGEASDSAAEAAELTENYQGALASDPLVNKDGDPLVAGDWYVNTGTGLIRAYTGSAWVTSVNVTAGVSNFSGGATGLTPSTLTQGDITLGGTLGVANGGTGLTSAGTSGNVLMSNGTGFTSTALPPGVPVGGLVYFSGGVSPDLTWLPCDGSVYTDTTYSALSAAVGNIPNNTTPTTTGTTPNAGAARQAARQGYVKLVSNGTNYYGFEWDYSSCFGSGSTAFTSTNGTTWTTAAVSAPSEGLALDLQYQNGLFFACGYNYVAYGVGTNALFTSTNFNTWNNVLSGSFYCARYLNDKYIVAGASGALHTSTNASTWTSRTSNTTSTIQGLAYGNKTYVYVGAGGALGTSTDGITWTARTSGTTSALYNLMYVNSKFVATGNNVAGTSTDGITWNFYRAAETPELNGLMYGKGGNFYGVNSNASGIGFSPDGVTWALFTTSTLAIYEVKSKDSNSDLVYLRVNPSSSGNLRSDLLNPFTYDTTTQFVVPLQSVTKTDGTGLTQDNSYKLYIKAS